MGDFKPGDKVLAKWPGSRRFLNATVVSLSEGKDKNSIQVQYIEDKSFSVVKVTDIKPEKPAPKSPRKKSVSPQKRGRAQSASKSPGRSPKSRSDSRGRKTERSPSRSPARTKPSKSPPKQRSRSRSTSKSKAPIPKAKTPTKTQTKTPTKTSTKTPTKTSITSGKKAASKKNKDEELFSSPDTSPIPARKGASPPSPRRRSRVVKNQEEDRTLMVKLSKIQTLDKEEVDGADATPKKIYSTRSKSAAQLEGIRVSIRNKKDITGTVSRMKAGFFGILVSVFSIAFFPILAVYLALNFVRKNNDLLTLPQLPKASAFFSYKVTGFYLLFVLAVHVLSLLPVGRVVRGFHSLYDKPRQLYRLNGVYVLLMVVSVLGLLAYLGQPIFFVHDNFFRLTCMATAFSFLASVLLYVRALFRPLAEISQFGDTGCTPYDFHYGRELNPRFTFGRYYDIKLVTLRTALIGWVVVNVCLMYKSYLLNGCLQWELALAGGAQILYATRLLYQEEAILATATVMHEGLGFGLVHATHVLAPFTFTLPVYYLVHHKPNLPLQCVAAMAILYLFAVFVNYRSLDKKRLVKRNPESLALTGQDLIYVAGSDAKALLSSGFWGLIRHPNYTSDILTFIAWTLPCGTETPLPYLPALLVFLSLLRRCFQVEAIMSRTYEETHLQYKHQVPNRLCPYVF